jgi:hypothetical protein
LGLLRRSVPPPPPPPPRKEQLLAPEQDSTQDEVDEPLVSEQDVSTAADWYDTIIDKLSIIILIMMIISPWLPCIVRGCNGYHCFGLDTHSSRFIIIMNFILAIMGALALHLLHTHIEHH